MKIHHRLLAGMQTARTIGQSLDGGDRCPLEHAHEQDAGIDRPPDNCAIGVGPGARLGVIGPGDNNGAGTAIPLSAAFL